MYLNSTYKAFVAEKAAKIVTGIYNRPSASGSLPLPIEETSDDHICVKAITIAVKLADRLEKWWQAKGDGTTLMFDVDDSLTSRIEQELGNIGEKIGDLTEEMERHHENLED